MVPHPQLTSQTRRGTGCRAWRRHVAPPTLGCEVRHRVWKVGVQGFKEGNPCACSFPNTSPPDSEVRPVTVPSAQLRKARAAQMATLVTNRTSEWGK